MLGVVLPEMESSIYGGQSICPCCGTSFNLVYINNDTVIKEFGQNYYLIKRGSPNCSHYSEDDRYAVLVRYSDFMADPEKYIDIFIEAESASGEKYALTIENKIYSWEHDDQTETYYKYVSAQTRYRDYEKVFVYLKPNFNGSLPVCTDFHVVTYNQLLKWIDSPSDAKICDFKTHIQNNLISKEIEFMDTDTKVLENYTKLKQIIKNAESKFEEVKRQIVADIFTKNNIQGMDYNPNENHDKEWDAIKKGTLVIEVANFGSCYRVYRKDLWYHHTDDLKNKFYFFVELKFCDNDPTKILVQKLIKRYGQKAQESVIYKFLDANKDIIHDGNTWGVLDTEKFIDLSAYNILAAEWKSALKEKAAKFITEAVAEMDEIFGRFESWKNEKQ